ncbi:MAG TPA: PRC-barrel domain-containing protein [Anaerolineales bacterium]|nr:PRC-barrel domain-containing protein [Anaerolineales bacterium]
MRLIKGADVYSANGDKLGSLGRVIIDPKSHEVTHIVVEKGMLFTTNKLVPIDNIEPRNEEMIILTSSERDLEELQDFEESEYVNLDATEYPEGEVESGQVETALWYPPMNSALWRTGLYTPYPSMPVYTVKTTPNIPEGTIALEEGARVVSKDDRHIGDIEQLIVEPQDNRVTHMVISDGFLFKERKLIPVLWITDISENEVHLSVGSGTLERLPAYEKAR